MSGCLVRTYSVAWLWSDLEALETWEATLAVSYVSLAARPCSTCSQSECVTHFLNVTFSRGIIGHPRQAGGELSSGWPTEASSLSTTYPFSLLVWWKLGVQ